MTDNNHDPRTLERLISDIRDYREPRDSGNTVAWTASEGSSKAQVSLRPYVPTQTINPSSTPAGD